MSGRGRASEPFWSVMGFWWDQYQNDGSNGGVAAPGLWLGRFWWRFDFFFRSERNKKKEIQRVLGIYLYIAFELSKCDDALYIGIAWLTYKLHEWVKHCFIIFLVQFKFSFSQKPVSEEYRGEYHMWKTPDNFFCNIRTFRLMSLFIYGLCGCTLVFPNSTSLVFLNLQAVNFLNDFFQRL